MNTFLQIGIGLLPGTILIIYILIKRRIFKIKNVLFAFFFTLVCGFTFFYGIINQFKGIQKSSCLSGKELMAIANAMVLEGGYEEACEVIEQYSDEHGYDDECRLLYSRIALLQGDFEKAAGLYSYLSQKSNLINPNAEEVQFAKEKTQNNQIDQPMLDYLKSIGKEVEENLITTQQISIEDITKEVERAIKAQYSISTEAKDCVEAVLEVSKVHTEQMNEKEIDDEETESIRRMARRIAILENRAPEYLTIECMNKARIKAYTIAGDYDRITEKISENSSYHELMISAELYMSKLVRQSDFPDEYQSSDQNKAQSVLKRVAQIYDTKKKGLPTQERNALKKDALSIVHQLEEPALSKMKQQLITASENEAGTDKTKVFLELAKIENYFENEPEVKDFLNTAIYSSQDCKDDNYINGMAQILSVISNDEDHDTENIKNVSKYVDQVLDHSLTVDVESIISPQENQEFAQTAVDIVSKIKSSITIGKIDISDFENIKARVMIDSDYTTDINKLKELLVVNDTGAKIEDFDIKKVNYTGSDIMLVCDVSGSMSNSIQDLSNAIETFTTDIDSNERLSVVTFSSNIVDRKPFGSSKEDLAVFAQNLSADGGTEMFLALATCLDDFLADPSKNNTIILMTDGQDNTKASSQDIYDIIGKLAEEKGIAVYTMGLGEEVDTFYLETIADSGNGDFIYVSDSQGLADFYNFLHMQTKNQYEISYKALDTITMSARTLEVTIPSEKVRDIKTYSLKDTGEETDGLEISQEISIAGVTPRCINKSSRDIIIQLKGDGFKKENNIEVKLNGNIDYSLDPSFVDAKTYQLTIPSSIAVGTYNVEVTLNGKKKILQNGFSVIVPEDQKTISFGPYIFTSMEQIENSNDSITLRGLVTMNGWLHFKGDITIAGDIGGGEIGVYDDCGSYVEFDQATAQGVGKFLAEKGIPLEIPPLYDFILYNDFEHRYDYSDYMVDDITTGVLELYDVIYFDSPVVRLYPDNIGLHFRTGSTILPYQDQILTTCRGFSSIFEFEYEGSACITDKNMGVVLDISYEDTPETGYNHEINLLNTPVNFNGSFKVQVDTIKSEYTLGAMVNLGFLTKDSGLGAEVSWKGQLIPDSVKLSLELENGIKLPTTIPIEADEFSFQVSDINSAIEKGTWTNLKFTGAASFNSVKIKEYIPALERFIGDLSLFEMPDTSASIKMAPFAMEANAELVFLSEIKLAEAAVKLGNFAYSNALLGIDNEDVGGLSASLKTGLMWDSANDRISVEVSGTGELDAHTRFVGVNYTGTIKYDIDFWIISTQHRQTGTMALGLYKDRDDKSQFVFAYKTKDKRGKIKGSFYYIDENGHCGKKRGALR